MGVPVVSSLVRSSPDRAVRIRALTGDIVHCLVFLGKTPYSHRASHHPADVMYKWAPASSMLGVILPSRGK